ncbi:MAG: hypothetical protein EON54_15460, partial [Alcaligenaceae bacterium]
MGRFLLPCTRGTAITNPMIAGSSTFSSASASFQAFLGDRHRASFYAVSLVMVMVWVWIAGKDLPWDTVNYHLYAGYSVFHDRFGVDYFPAGGQTYLTPYSYVPLYLMAAAEWPSIAVGAVLACMHVTILWMTWELGRIVSRRSDGSSPPIVGWAAAALALA